MKRANLMRKSVMLGLGLILLLALSVGAYAVSFSDVSGHWAEERINWWADHGYVNGYLDGTFKPDQIITRAEFMVLINRSHDYTKTAEINFSDVAATDWFYNDVAIAAQVGYIGGYEDGTMKPGQSLTRQEAVVIVAKLAAAENNAEAADVFLDANVMPDWSKGSIGALSKAGVISGYPDGEFKPFRNITRAEALMILRNYMDYVGFIPDGTTTPGTTTPDSSGTIGTVTPDSSGTTTPDSSGTIQEYQASGGGGGGSHSGTKDYLADLFIYTNVYGDWIQVTSDKNATTAEYIFDSEMYNNEGVINDARIRITSLGISKPTTVDVKTGLMNKTTIDTETAYSIEELFGLGYLRQGIQDYLDTGDTYFKDAADVMAAGLDAMNGATTANDYEAARDSIFQNAKVVEMFTTPRVADLMKSWYGITADVSGDQITSMHIEITLSKSNYKNMTLTVSYQ